MDRAAALPQQVHVPIDKLTVQPAAGDLRVAHSEKQGARSRQGGPRLPPLERAGPAQPHRKRVQRQERHREEVPAHGERGAEEKAGERGRLQPVPAPAPGAPALQGPPAADRARARRRPQAPGQVPGVAEPPPAQLGQSQGRAGAAGAQPEAAQVVPRLRQVRRERGAWGGLMMYIL